MENVTSLSSPHSPGAFVRRNWFTVAKIGTIFASVWAGLIALHYLWLGFFLGFHIEYNELDQPGIDAANIVSGHAFILGLVSVAALILAIVAAVRRRGYVPLAISLLLVVIVFVSVPSLSNQLDHARAVCRLC